MSDKSERRGSPIGPNSARNKPGKGKMDDNERIKKSIESGMLPTPSESNTGKQGFTSNRKTPSPNQPSGRRSKNLSPKQSGSSSSHQLSSSASDVSAGRGARGRGKGASPRQSPASSSQKSSPAQSSVSTGGLSSPHEQPSDQNKSSKQRRQLYPPNKESPRRTSNSPPSSGPGSASSAQSSGEHGGENIRSGSDSVGQAPRRAIPGEERDEPGGNRVDSGSRSVGPPAKRDEVPEEKPKKKEESEVKKKQTPKWATLLHVIKANVGTGILAMPKAISNFGLLAGGVGIVILGIICIYCMHLLVKCSKKVVNRINDGELNSRAKKGSSKSNVESRESHSETNAAKDKTQNFTEKEFGVKELTCLDYAATIEYAFILGPKKLQKYSTAMRYLVNTLLVFTQFGFCCVYFLFVGNTMSKILKHTNATEISVSNVMLIEWPILIVINLFPSLKALSIITTVSCVIQAIGLALMLQYFYVGKMASSHHYYINPSVSKWPLFFGTAMYSFEGIGVVLPLENEMKEKKAFRGFFGILNIGMVIVCSLYLLIGVSGYIKYGNNIKSSVTFNLPAEWLSEVIHGMFAVAIFMTYPLQMYVAFTFIIPFLNKKLVNEKWSSWIKITLECFFRALMVTITFAIARAVPMLDLVISFVGAFASSGLAIILPPILHAVCIHHEKDMPYRRMLITSDIFIAAFGVFGLIVGAGVSVKEMVERIKSGHMEEGEN